MVFSFRSLWSRASEPEAAMENNRSKEERRLLRKLDLFIMSYACFSYFFNFVAFANAYVAGLKEDIHLVGNQYSILLSLTTAGMVIGQIPNAIIIQKIPPRIWLPSMVILWGSLTMAHAGCKTYSQLCAVRFFLGFAEACGYSGCIYIIGSWYTPKELAKRTAWFTIAGQVGTMFAGVMMTAIKETMDGYSGLKGWQWVFLIDGIITLPVALWGYLSFPDTPEKTRASYLTPAQRQLALSRVPPKHAYSNNISPLSLLKRVCGTPQFYCLILLSATCSAMQAFPLQGLFLLWLKNHKGEPFTQANITTYPLGIQAVGIVSELIVAYFLDITGNRIVTGMGIIAVQIVCASVLLVPNMSYAGSFFAFYASGSSYAVNPLMYQWANIILGREGDDAKRGVILASMVGTGMILWTFWGIALYPATDAPYWKKGSITIICVSVALVGVVFLVRWVDGYTTRSAAVRNSEASDGDRDGSIAAEKVIVRDEKAQEAGQTC